MGQRGRPRTLVAIRLHTEGIETIDALAKAEQIGRSEMIRRLLSEALTARAKQRT